MTDITDTLQLGHALVGDIDLISPPIGISADHVDRWCSYKCRNLFLDRVDGRGKHRLVSFVCDRNRSR